eukprot:1855954-Prymnesium_polylepis.1
MKAAPPFKDWAAPKKIEMQGLNARTLAQQQWIQELEQALAQQSTVCRTLEEQLATALLHLSRMTKQMNGLAAENAELLERADRAESLYALAAAMPGAADGEAPASPERPSAVAAAEAEPAEQQQQQQQQQQTRPAGSARPADRAASPTAGQAVRILEKGEMMLCRDGGGELVPVQIRSAHAEASPPFYMVTDGARTFSAEAADLL